MTRYLSDPNSLCELTVKLEGVTYPHIYKNMDMNVFKLNHQKGHRFVKESYSVEVFSENISSLIDNLRRT